MFMLHGRLAAWPPGRLAAWPPGRLAAKPGMRDELLAILCEGERDERMPGCRLYLVAVDDTDADGVWVTEVWESEDAHTASLQLARVKEQIARAMPMLDPAGFQRQQLDARAGIPG
jgi:quinol monooxygenase YgiN